MLDDRGGERDVSQGFFGSEQDLLETDFCNPSPSSSYSQQDASMNFSTHTARSPDAVAGPSWSQLRKKIQIELLNSVGH